MSGYEYRRRQTTRRGGEKKRTLESQGSYTYRYRTGKDNSTGYRNRQAGVSYTNTERDSFGGNAYRAPGPSRRKNYSHRSQGGFNTAYKRSRELEECLALEEESEREFQEYLERKQKRQEQKRRKELLLQKKRALLLKQTGVMLIFFVVLFLGYKLFFSNPVLKKVTVEAGTEGLKTADFLRKKKLAADFVTDMSKINLNHIGEQEVILKVKGKERKSRLIIEDTTAPEGEAYPIKVDIDGKVKAEELVKNIEDATEVTCSFKEKPDLSQKGTIQTTIVLTDEGGNTTEVESEIEVIEDKEAPAIDGVAPLESFIGDPISYKSKITVTDNCDREVKLQIDNSDVEPEKAGTYEVVYTAEDRAGNKTVEETTITIKEKPENYIEPEQVEEEADEVLSEITKKKMTKKEKARAIYDWTRMNVNYISTSDKDSWTNGAHQGFTEREGDCFVYFAVAKALLTQAGIPNIDVVKSDTSHSRHYWSLIDCGDGWYHFDTTPRIGGGEFFMLTDEELLDYSENNDNSHIFDQSLYPATPTVDSEIE